MDIYVAPMYMCAVGGLPAITRVDHAQSSGRRDLTAVEAITAPNSQPPWGRQEKRTDPNGVPRVVHTSDLIIVIINW